MAVGLMRQLNMSLSCNPSYASAMHNVSNDRDQKHSPRTEKVSELMCE